MGPSVKTKFIVTKLARNHLERLHLAGVQIARAQIETMASRITSGPGDNGAGGDKAFLPVELTDLDPSSYGANWAGLQLISRGHDGEAKIILVDLIVQGPEWQYRYGDFTFPEHLPETVKQAIDTDPEKFLGMGQGDGINVMHTGRTFEGVTVKVTQEETELSLQDIGRKCTKTGDCRPILPLPAIGKRIAEIAEVFEAERVPFENAINAYWQMCMWVSDEPVPFMLENFPLSREWMACARGMATQNGISIDVKRMGGSSTPEYTAGEQTAHELEELEK